MYDKLPSWSKNAANNMKKVVKQYRLVDEARACSFWKNSTIWSRFLQSPVFTGHVHLSIATVHLTTAHVHLSNANVHLITASI